MLRTARTSLSNTNLCASCGWEAHKRELGQELLARELHQYCKECECEGIKKAPTAEAVEA